MQNDLAAEGGVRFHARALSVIDPILRLREQARKLGWPVLYTRRVHETSVFENKQGTAPWCVRGTTGVSFIDELKPDPSELVIRKRTWDGFFDTELDSMLRDRGVRSLVLVGNFANEGVLVTAGEAALRWYDIVLPVDAVAGRTEFDEQATFREISFLYQGTLTTTDSFLAGQPVNVQPNLTVVVPEQSRKDSLELKASETAVIVVDMQNDFAREGGALFVQDALNTIDPIRELLAKSRGEGVLTVFTQDWHRPDDFEFRIWPVHAVAGTPGAEVIDSLEVRDNDLQIRKMRYDGFFGTSLHHLLSLRDIKNVLVVGTVTNICVLHTAGKASLYGYKVAVAEDGTSSLDPFDQALGLRQVTEVFSGDVCHSGGIKFRKEI